MAFEQTTSNDLVGSMSPHHLSLALNGGAQHFAINANSATTIALIRAPIPQQRLKVLIRADGAFGAGESLVVSARYLNSAGTLINIGVDTLDVTNIPAAGSFESAFVDVPGLDVGSVVELIHVYVAGATPNNPILSMSLQFS